MNLRIGTRGSDLALTQTRMVCSLLAQHYPQITFEEIIIRTHGDSHATQAVTDADWPIGGFVGAIERALLAGEIDIAVHSYKDLPTQETPGLAVVAAPVRGPAHDVLVTREAVELASLPDDMRIGTSSPRRAAQMRTLGRVQVAAIRGNVPTRLAKVEAGEIDGVVLAAAGLERLHITPKHTVALPTDMCLPAPGQGALAVQLRADDQRREMIRAIDHKPTSDAVQAERALLRELGVGCATPLGVLARIERQTIIVRGQLFDDERGQSAVATARGHDPVTMARQLADELQRALRSTEEGES